MNILFIVDRFPFPPRDGVSIPTAGLIQLLSSLGHTVFIDVVVNATTNLQLPTVTDFNYQDSRVRIIKRQRKNFLISAISELTGKIPFFLCWRYTDPIDLPSAVSIDVIFASPINVLDYALEVSSSKIPVNAAINDVFTSVLRSMTLTSRTLKGYLWWAVSRLRGIWIGRLEATLLSRCANILVQTEVDRKWIHSIGGELLYQKSIALPNGVDSDLFIDNDLGFQKPPVVLFAASFDNLYYRGVLQWFYKNIWPSIVAANPDAILRITGRGLEGDPYLFHSLNLDPTVSVLGFLEHLRDVYSGVRVAIAPIFKSYGFINKVAEALAAGIPVVGDQSAFNGLEGAIFAGAVKIASSPREFSEAINALITDDALWEAHSRAAIAFSRAELPWSSRSAKLKSLIDRIQR